jgi:hypothetical protein
MPYDYDAYVGRADHRSWQALCGAPPASRRWRWMALVAAALVFAALVAALAAALRYVA